MLLHRLAAGLVFVAGLGVLKAAVAFESWPLLLLGLTSALAGLCWFTFAGSGQGTSPRRDAAFAR